MQDALNKGIEKLETGGQAAQRDSTDTVLAELPRTRNDLRDTKNRLAASRDELNEDVRAAITLLRQKVQKVNGKTRSRPSPGWQPTQRPRWWRPPNRRPLPSRTPSPSPPASPQARPLRVIRCPLRLLAAPPRQTLIVRLPGRSPQCPLSAPARRTRRRRLASRSRCGRLFAPFWPTNSPPCAPSSPVSKTPRTHRPPPLDGQAPGAHRDPPGADSTDGRLRRLAGPAGHDSTGRRRTRCHQGPQRTAAAGRTCFVSDPGLPPRHVGVHHRAHRPPPSLRVPPQITDHGNERVSTTIWPSGRRDTLAAQAAVNGG